MESSERRSREVDTDPRSSDEISPLAFDDKKKKKDKGSKTKSKDGDKKKTKKSKKKSKQSPSEPPEDRWDQQKRSDGLDRSHQFAVDFTGADFALSQSQDDQAQILKHSNPRPTTDPGLNARHPVHPLSHLVDTGGPQFSRIIPTENELDMAHNPRVVSRNQASNDVEDEQSVGGWVIDDTNRGEKIVTYNRRRSSVESNQSHSPREAKVEVNTTLIEHNHYIEDQRGSEHSGYRSSHQAPYTSGYMGEYHSQYGDERSRRIGGSSFADIPPKGTGSGYQGSPRQGDSYYLKEHVAPFERDQGDEQLKYDDAYYEGYAPDRLGDVIGEDSFYDSGTIRSDITGLTGAFSSMYNSRYVHNRNECIYEPDVVPLGYPKYNSGTYGKFEMMEVLERKKRRQEHGPPAGVRFGLIDIRHYERVLGDNPSCTSGASISIGWRYREQKCIILDEFESKKGPKKRPDKLILTRDQRELMLLELGYSQKDIAAAIRNNLRDKNKRRQTVQNLSASGVEESLEGAAKSVKRIFGFGRSK